MKKLFCLLLSLFVCCDVARAGVAQILVDTSNFRVSWPTNFWAANASNIVAVTPIDSITSVAGMVNMPNSVLALNTNSLRFWGANTSLLSATFTFGLGGWPQYRRVLSASNTVFASPVNGHGVYTNTALGVIASNSVVGFEGIQTWTNLLFGSNVGFSASFGVTNITNGSTLKPAGFTTPNGRVAGFVFRDSRTFPSTGDGAEKAFVALSDDYGANITVAPNPIFEGTPRGISVRDPAMPWHKIGNKFICSYTSNAFMAGGVVMSAGFPLHLCTNLNSIGSGWVTNISMIPTNWTAQVATSTVCWSPNILINGPADNTNTSVVILGSINTNFYANPFGFVTLARAGTVGGFPYDLGPPFLFNFAPGISNILDLTPVDWELTKTTLLFWGKNELTGFIELFQIGSTNLAEPATAIQTGNHSSWGSGVEGFTHTVRMPNNPDGTPHYRLIGPTRYQPTSYGGNGDGRKVCFAESDNLTFGWSRLTNVNDNGFVIGSSAKLMLVESDADWNQFKSLYIANSSPRGTLVVAPAIGSSLSGLTSMGWAVSNNIVVTSDYSAIRLGVGFGLDAQPDGSVRLAVQSPNISSSTRVLGAFSRYVAEWSSNGNYTMLGGAIASSYLQPVSNGLAFQGGTIGCDGTNWWTVLRNSGGVFSTNKVTLTPWP